METNTDTSITFTKLNAYGFTLPALKSTITLMWIAAAWIDLLFNFNFLFNCFEVYLLFIAKTDTLEQVKSKPKSTPKPKNLI